ncbi:MAG: amino acid ABC transporter ATP-binding protein [Bacteroidales bacterium]|nr:amino acid ABC transporter ATP-binding protein [Bacteroidales bacterium]
MITVTNLSKNFLDSDNCRVDALKGVSFHVSKGEVVSIIGPSAAGKSTLLRALNLLDPPTSGSIKVEGEEILTPGYPRHKLCQRMGMVFQQFNLFPHLSVLENVMLAPMKVLGIPREEAEALALDNLRKVSLSERAVHMPGSLSGGQQQRAAIARCLAMHPDIILFDEPTSALDPTMVGEVQGVIRLLAQEKMTMLIVTHNMRFAHDIATRTFFMYNGTILEEGTPDDLFNHPSHLETRTFVQRIHKLVFDIESRNFDFYDMMSQIRQFCIRFAIPEHMNSITHIVEEMLLLLSAHNSPVHIEVNHSELSNQTSVIILHRGETVSPLDRPDTDEIAVMIIRGMSKEISTEQKPDGIQLTFKI